MKLTRSKLLFLGVVAAIILGGMIVVLSAVCAQQPPEKPVNATFEATGNGTNIYNNYGDRMISAKIFKMNVSGVIYDSYCLDIYTPLYLEKPNLTVNGPLSEGNQSVNWTAVNYILYTYNYSAAEDKNLSAAAIQAAIWYFTSEPYGPFNSSNTSQKYQFMSDNNLTENYDGKVLPPYNASDVRNLAFEIINDTKANASDFQFPTGIKLNASEE